MNRTLEERARELAQELLDLWLPNGGPASGGAPLLQDLFDPEALPVYQQAILRHLTDLSRDYSQKIQELEERLNNSNAWWATRSQRLQDWARAELTDELQERFFAIVANGTASPFENPTYAQQMNMLRAERDALRADKERWIESGKAARSALDKLMGDSDLPDDDSIEMKACQMLARQLDSKKGEK